MVVLCHEQRSSGELLIKKIIKDKLPIQEQYSPACENNYRCKCKTCDPAAIRPPLELILLQSKASGLPALVECIEDEEHYFIVTKCHGTSRKRWKHLSSWFGTGRWSQVYWNEYFS
jgi:hypothetical protein